MEQKGDSNARRVSQYLPVPLLARILRPLDQVTRLRTCALVCSDWHKAAVVSTRDITAKSRQAAALSAWLADHGPKVQLTSIAVTSALPEWPAQPQRGRLVLPVQLLSQLRDLRLSDVDASVVDAHGSAAPLFGSPGWVTGLTRLELRCNISLQGLQSCTALQHLDFRPPYAEPVQTGAGLPSVSLLLEALPQLSSQLTFLQLHGPACPDRLMGQLSTLHALRELRLKEATCSTASFSSLPHSLTRLDVSLLPLDASGTFLGKPVFSPSTTPGIAQLTALQDLTISEARAVDVALLSSLVQLSRLCTPETPLLASEGGPTLRALSALTQLRHLSPWAVCEVRGDPDEVAPDAEDLAALTASQQLTYLQLPGGIHPGRGGELFPHGVQLPHLEELVMPLELIFGCDAVPKAVNACVAIKRLSIENPSGFYQIPQPLKVYGYHVALLAGLGALTKLHFFVYDHCMVIGPEEWGAFALLTGLQELTVGIMQTQCVDGFEQLTALRQLTHLCHSWEMDREFAEFKVINTAPAGSPSNVWSQLPAIAPQLLGPCVEAMATLDGEVDVDTQQRILRHILGAFWGALEARVGQQEQQQELEQEQQELELIQLRQRVGALEAQVAGLQAELAAARR